MEKEILIDCKWVEKGTGEVREMRLTMADLDRLYGWERLGVIEVIRPQI